MRPEPFTFETADGVKYTIDCLTLGQIRKLEDFFGPQGREKRQSMGGIEQGMHVLGIIMSEDNPDVDVSKIRLVGGANKLAEITQAALNHGGMVMASEGEPQPTGSR